MTDLRAALEAAAESVRTAIAAAANAGPDDFVLAPEPRHTADSITVDTLDQLYARLAKAERAEGAGAEAAQLRADIDTRDETIRHLDAGLTHERARATQAERHLLLAAHVAADERGRAYAAEQRTTLAEAAADRARALHRQVTYCRQRICAECSAYAGDSTDNSPCAWPCPTITALNEEPTA